MSDQKGITSIIFLIGILILSSGIIGGSLFVKSQKPSSKPVTIADNPQNNTIMIYKSPYFGYSFEYPSNLKLNANQLVPSNREIDFNEINLNSPDLEYNKNKHYLASGYFIKISVIFDGRLDPEEISFYSPIFPYKPVFDNALLPLSLKLPSEASATAYTKKSSESETISDKVFVIDIFTKNLLPPNQGRRAAIQFTCIGDIGKCQPIMVKIVSTFKFIN